MLSTVYKVAHAGVRSSLGSRHSGLISGIYLLSTLLIIEMTLSNDWLGKVCIPGRGLDRRTKSLPTIVLIMQFRGYNSARPCFLPTMLRCCLHMLRCGSDVFVLDDNTSISGICKLVPELSTGCHSPLSGRSAPFDPSVSGLCLAVGFFCCALSFRSRRSQRLPHGQPDHAHGMKTDLKPRTGVITAPTVARTAIVSDFAKSLLLCYLQPSRLRRSRTLGG